MFDMFHPFKGFIINLCFVNSSCILISKHDHVLQFNQHLLLVQSRYQQLLQVLKLCVSFTEYLMSGSPRTYPTASSCKPPKSPAGMQMSGGGGGPSSKDFLQPGDTAGLTPAAKTSTISSQHR